jgi:two-component system NtrC family sensor kinase
MKLVTKLTITFVIVACALIVYGGGRRFQRELLLFREDRALDHRRLGHALALAAAAVRRDDGPAAARGFVENVGANDEDVSIRWVCDPSHLERTVVPCEELGRIQPGSELFRITSAANGELRHWTWTPVPGEPHSGYIEVSEPGDEEELYRRHALRDTVVTGVSLALALAVTAFVLGVLLVGQPTRRLIDLARRVGRGELSARLDLPQRDELGALAAEMNAMAEKLERATLQAARDAKERIAALEQLRHVDRLTTVGKLASGLAHELGTPLSIIEAHSEMIAARDVTGDAAVGAAKSSLEAVERMTRIIGELLAFARPRILERTENDVVSTVRHAVRLVSPLASKANVALSVDAEGQCLAPIDVIQVQQAVTNLVMNAVQAAKPGCAGNITVEVHLKDVARKRPSIPPVSREEPASPYVCIRVTDDGIGIADEHMDHLFDPFFTTKEVGQGTGLGLGIAYGIARDHGGWMDVESELGKGSVFSLYLPTSPS